MADRLDHPNLPIVVGDGIATVTIDRPDARNSLTPEMIDALFAALPALDQARRVPHRPDDAIMARGRVQKEQR